MFIKINLRLSTLSVLCALLIILPNLVSANRSELDSDWGKKQEILIYPGMVAGEEVLEGFPVLITEGSFDNLVFAEAKYDGCDIRFSKNEDLNNAEELPFEIVEFDPSGDKAQIWVKTDLNPKERNSIWIWWENNSAECLNSESKYGPENVWREEFVGVWHLNEELGVRRDSSFQSNDLNDRNIVGFGEGVFSGIASDFEIDNIDEELYIPDDEQSGLDINDDFSVSFWGKPESFDLVNNVINKDDADLPENRGYLVRQLYDYGARRLNVLFNDGDGNQSAAKSSSDFFIQGEWVHGATVVSVSSGIDGISIWRNGVLDNNIIPYAHYGNIATKINDNNTDFSVGAGRSTGLVAGEWDGQLQEVRLWSGLYPNGWVETEYNNQSNPSEFAVGQRVEETDLDKIKIYSSDGDGYVTNWLIKSGSSNELWKEMHDSAKSTRANSDRAFIEVGVGFSSDNRLFTHRAIIPFDLNSIINNGQKITNASLKIFPFQKTIFNNDEHSYISIVLVKKENSLIDVYDYGNIGESTEYGWGNAFREDIILGSEKVYINDIELGRYLSVPLNEKALEWLNNRGDIYLGIREGHDLMNIYPNHFMSASAERLIFHSYENGTTTMPHLEIEYESSEEDGIEPVILIPGIMGSWEVDGEMVLDPILQVYDDLYYSFVANGYVEGENLFAFPYQWRNSNIDTADKLGDLIDEVLSSSSASRVDIVAHSMGGIVTREYLSREGSSEKVDQLVFMGTPHRGSPEAYLTWEGGDFGKGASAWVMEKYFDQEAEEHGYDDEFEYIRGEGIVSVEQLLPTYDYLYDKQDKELRVYPEEYPRNEFLERLNSEDVLSHLASTSILNILGKTDEDTINHIKVKNINEKKRDGYIMWEHGKPSGWGKLVMGPGDGTVPKESNSNFLDLDDVYINKRHSELPEESQEKVLKFLGLEDVGIVDRKEPWKMTVMFRLFSPVDMQIVNRSGERLGKDFETGENMAEIYRSFYSGHDKLSEFATIVNPETDEYRIILEGVDDGPFKLSVSTYDGENEEEVFYHGHIKKGQVQVLVIERSDEGLGKIRKGSLENGLFDKLKSDLDELNVCGEILNPVTYEYLLKKIRVAEMLYDNFYDNHNFYEQKVETVEVHMKVLQAHLRFFVGENWISEEAYEILMGDMEEVLGEL